MKKQSGKNKLVINEEFIFDQDKYQYGLNIHFKVAFLYQLGIHWCKVK